MRYGRSALPSICPCLALSLWKTVKPVPALSMFALTSSKHQDILSAASHDDTQLDPADGGGSVSLAWPFNSGELLMANQWE